MKYPLVSIITPCFNSEKTISHTLESVINQSYKNIEYIIIDGGSTDNTLDLIEEYRKRSEINFKVISEKDSGIYDAMNKGIFHAQGELIGIINSDDWYELNAVEKAVQKYNCFEKYQIIYGAVTLYKNNIEYQTILKYHHYLKENMILHPGCFVSKKVYRDYGVFNLKYKISADYEFMLRVSNNKEVVFYPITDTLAHFRLGGMSSTIFGSIDTTKVKYQYGLITKRQFIKKIGIMKFKLAIKKIIKKV